jgi:hypothetical protein
MLNVEDTWIFATGTNNGQPQVLRLRANLVDIVGCKSHPKLLRITWKYATADASGLPSADLNDIMATFENAIVSELESDFLAIFVSVWVWNGIKEWTAYTSDAQRICDRLNQAVVSHEPFSVELTVEEDSTWHVYTTLMNTVNPK